MSPGRGSIFWAIPSRAEAIECLYNISSEHGADMTVLRSEDVVETIVQTRPEKRSGRHRLGKAGHSPAAISRRNCPWRMPEVEIHSVYAED
jgi:hypothetical protein